MQFQYPSFLWALLAIAIPIIIHLFHFRRFKTVYFSNVQFLKEVKEETAKRNRLKHLLVLLSRILAVAALVFAFAQPFIPVGDEVSRGAKAVSIYIDNSFSMQSEAEDVSLLELAKIKAREIVSAYSVEDEFQIITSALEGREQRLIGQEDALTYIDEIKASPAANTLSKVFNRQQQTLKKSKNDKHFAYWISDFQRTTADVEQASDSTITSYLVPLKSVEQRNVSIDSAWFDTPVQMMNERNRLLVKLFNHSDDELDNLRLSMTHEGQSRPLGTLSIPARASTIDTVDFPILKNGWHDIVLNIKDYPIQFDDAYHISFPVADNIKVLIINDGISNQKLKAVFNTVSFFKVSESPSSRLDYAAFGSHDLIILDEVKSLSSGLAFELKSFIESGGNVLFFPSETANVATYNAFLQSLPANVFKAFEKKEKQVGGINTEEFIFNNVFLNRTNNIKLPQTQGNFNLSSFSNRNTENLLTYRDGKPFVTKNKIMDGHLYTCVAPLQKEWNNLVLQAEVFVPMLYKMAISTGKQSKVSHTIGKDDILELEHQRLTEESTIKIGKEALEFIPEQRSVGNKTYLGVHNQVQEAGVYQAYSNSDSIYAHYAFNFDRTESLISFYNESDLKEKIEDNTQQTLLTSNQQSNLKEVVGERSKGKTYWRLFLIIALICLAIELLLLRFL